MKKKSHLNSQHRLSSSLRISLALMGLGLALQAQGNPELDHQYDPFTVATLKAWDNVDGLFNETVQQAFQEYFSEQNRFTVTDLSAADFLLSQSKIPYPKIISDPDILKQLARSSKSQTLLRTRIIKEGPQYRISLDWLLAPQMDLIAHQEAFLEDIQTEHDSLSSRLIPLLKSNLNQLLAQVPFIAQVTGRDGPSVTVNLGQSSGLEPGDVLEIGTLSAVKKHPLLKKIVDWQFSRSGRVEVLQVEDQIAFCKVLSEEPSQEILRSQKVLHIQKRVKTPAQEPSTPEPTQPKQPALQVEDQEPKLFTLGFSLFPGSLDRQFSATGAPSYSGGGLSVGSQALGEVILTRRWFSGIEFRYSLAQFFQKDLASGAQSAASQQGGVVSSLFSYKIYAGYWFLQPESPLKPRAWIKMTYNPESYHLPTSSTELTGPLDFSALLIGLGGELPIRENSGIMGHLSYRLLSSVSSTWVTSSVNTSTKMDFYLGAYYRIYPELSIKLGIDVSTSQVIFSTSENIDQKMVSFAPTLLYYF
ncbi:MAG: hypothetical protein ACO3A2_01435 [Bdellovibrionia bacterium]